MWRCTRSATAGCPVASAAELATHEGAAPRCSSPGLPGQPAASGAAFGPWHPAPLAPRPVPPDCDALPAAASVGSDPQRMDLHQVFGLPVLILDRPRQPPPQPPTRREPNWRCGRGDLLGTLPRLTRSGSGVRPKALLEDARPTAPRPRAPFSPAPTAGEKTVCSMRGASSWATVEMPAHAAEPERRPRAAARGCGNAGSDGVLG